MKFSLKNQKENLKKISGQLASLWVKKNSWIFISVWLVISILIFSLWYFWIFKYDWSPEKKEAYRKEKSQGVILDEGRYQRVLLEMENRRRKMVESNFLQARDVFGLTK